MNRQADCINESILERGKAIPRLKGYVYSKMTVVLWYAPSGSALNFLRFWHYDIVAIII